jgi:hypothetical protein
MQTLEKLAHFNRSLYCRLVHESIGHADTTGTCFYAAVLVCESVARFTGFEACIRGGDGKGDGGFRSREGSWHGHYWTEARDPATGQAWVIDLTADQFGEHTVRILTLAAASEQYHPGDQAVVDAHVIHEGFVIGACAWK